MLAAEHGVGASVPTVSAAGTTPTALRPRHPCRVVNARVGHEVGLRCALHRRTEQRRPPYTYAVLVGWSTPRVGRQAGLRCAPHRRPEQRRPPSTRAVCRVVNAPRWPPGGASVPTVSAAGTTPTALPPRRPCRVVNATRWPPGRTSVPTVSAAGTTPTALPPRRL